MICVCWWFVYDICGLVVCLCYMRFGDLFMIYVVWWFVCVICGLVVCL